MLWLFGYERRLFGNGCLKFIFIVIGFTQLNLSIAGKYDAGPKLPCTPKRTEISFPVVNDINGRLTSLVGQRSPLSGLLYVTFKWRRRKIDVILYKNELTTSRTHTEWSSGNVTYAKVSHKDCYYQGYVKGQRSSYVALSTREGLSGYVQTDEELLFIQPSTYSMDEQRQAHLIYTCEPRRLLTDPEWEQASTSQQLKRRRRSITRDNPKYLEVMVAVDHSLVEEVGSREKAEDYVMALMNIANTVYQHHSLGVDIRVVVVRLIFLDKSQQADVFQKNDAFRTVNLFCHWSMHKLPPGDPTEFDISVLITKEDLGPSGYAPITGLCNPTRSCAAVKDDGFTTGFIIAHEMAHVFGLFHDGHGNSCYGRKYDTAMMAAMVESKLNHFWWSECSSRRMKEMVRYLFCLNNQPKPIEGHYPLKAPEELEKNIGKPWSLDFQCRMEFGPYFQLCAAFYSDPCGVLWCSSRVSNPNMCRTKRGPPLPGSPCGHERECRNERCLYIGDMKPVDGHWGNWLPWSGCSSVCGVGVRHRARACDNPAPAYDGKDCEGESNMWETCVNNTCALYEDSRAAECRVWDSLQIRYGTHDWQPFEGHNESSLCRQTCKSFYTQDIVTIEVDVSDGTPCSYSLNNSNICVAGKCLNVGCDGKINSTKREDMCGICGGNGSQCKVVKGIMRKKPTSVDSYLPALLLPSGARNITIMETVPSQQFLAIQINRYSKFSLNGDKHQSKSQKLVISGAMFEYTSNRETGAETVFTPGPIRQDLQVFVYPNRLSNEISLNFSYTVHKSDFTLELNKYYWKFDTWSACSVTCGQGVQTIVHNCHDKDTEEKVADELCSVLTAPRKDEVRCHREKCGRFRYNYAMSVNYSDCDAKCGEEGVEVQLFTCERINDLDKIYESVAMHHCSHLSRPHHSRVCRGQPCNVTESLRWSVSSNWTECPCGEEGNQTRDVTCERVVTTLSADQSTAVETVHSTLCNHQTDMPVSTRACKGLPCGPVFRWAESGKFSSCNGACDEEGEEEEILVCEQVTSEDGEEVVETADDYFCENIIKPEPVTRKCLGTTCEEKFPKFNWQPTDQWTDCNATCDQTGKEARIYKCQKVTKNSKEYLVNDEHCEGQTKEEETKSCEGPPCPLKWSIGIWSGCSVTCGEGKRYRDVYCGDPDTDIDDIRCTDEPPATSKFCQMRDCPGWQEGRRKYEWEKVTSNTPPSPLLNTDLDLLQATQTTSEPPTPPRPTQPRDEECVDEYSFCSAYKSLDYRCRRSRFHTKCCRTCTKAQRSATRRASRSSVFRRTIRSLQLERQRKIRQLGQAPVEAQRPVPVTSIRGYRG